MIGTRTSTRADTAADALLRPFPGLRYDLSVAGPLHTLLAPPHTELDKAARRAVMDASPHVVTRLERPEYRGPMDPVDGPAVLRWISAGVLVQDDPSFYVVSQRDGGTDHRFLLAALAVGPGHDRWTLAHENTIPEALASRVTRLQQTAVDSEPVLVLTSAGGVVADVLGAPQEYGDLILAGDAAGVGVQLWRLSEPSVLLAVERATTRTHLLIADGHHRYAAVRRIAEESGQQEQVLVAVADQSSHPVELVALHRVSPGVHAPSMALAARRVRRVLPHDVDAEAERLTPVEFLVVSGDDAFVITGDGPDAGAWIDAQLTLSGVDPGRIRYVADPDEVRHHRRAGTVVFLPRPEVSTIVAWARSGRLLGRKSTSFRPKPLAGTVMRLR